MRKTIPSILFCSLLLALSFSCSSNNPSPSTPTATVGNVTVSSTGTSITEATITITVSNDTFKAKSGGDDVSEWFSNKPFGATLKVSADVATGSATIAITASGYPSSTMQAAMAITIPGSSLNRDTAVTVASNANAKWDVTASGWQVVGNGRVLDDHTQSHSFAMGTDGTSYVAYVSDDYVTHISKCGPSETAWTTISNLGTKTDSTNHSICLVTKGTTPYIAISDAGNSGKLAVLEYNGSTWSTIGSTALAGTIGAASSISAAFDSDGNLYVAFVDGGNNSKVTVLKCDSSNTWSMVGAAGFGSINTGTMSGRRLDLAIEPKSKLPWVIFVSSAPEQKSTVMKFDGSAWGSEMHPSDVKAKQAAIDFDGSGNVYVAYQDVGSSHGYPVVYKSPISSIAWSQLYSDTTWKATNIDLAFVDGKPTLVFQNNQSSLTYEQYDGSAWSPLIVLSAIDSSFHFNMLCSYGAIPYVAYENASYQPTVLKYKT